MPWPKEGPALLPLMISLLGKLPLLALSSWALWGENKSRVKSEKKNQTKPKPGKETYKIWGIHNNISCLTWKCHWHQLPGNQPSPAVSSVEASPMFLGEPSMAYLPFQMPQSRLWLYPMPAATPLRATTSLWQERNVFSNTKRRNPLQCTVRNSSQGWTTMEAWWPFDQRVNSYSPLLAIRKKLEKSICLKLISEGEKKKQKVKTVAYVFF